MYQWRVENKPDKHILLTHGFSSDELRKATGLSKDRFQIIADNLFRLRLCQPAASSGVGVGTAPLALVHYEIICLTPLGYDFVMACRGPQTRAA